MVLKRKSNGGRNENNLGYYIQLPQAKEQQEKHTRGARKFDRIGEKRNIRFRKYVKAFSSSGYSGLYSKYQNLFIV